MRNLKRAFSLVLALVMALSMVTIAPVAAADETTTMVTSNFSDAAEIKYTEAVAITGGIGLFAGADGKFMPKGTVTRAQMATIIVKMLYGGDVNADSFKGSGKFIDTAYFEGGWAEGYINWCATLGIVAGYGDGTFKPGNQVTTAEAATMILNALKIDAGAGTWPNTVMAKAEEEDFFEDLKPMPGTNTALTREELAVIALNGLNWTATEDNGWYVTGGNADTKMTFDSYKDAQKYADKVGGQVQALEGRDSLANKVYDLKKAEGVITANQATGEKYTEITVNWDPVATAKFNVVTDASLIGHKVVVWYEENYVSEKEPGQTYAVSEAAEYITLAEAVDSAKEYKTAFGVKYDLPASLTLTSGTGYVTAGTTIEGYVAGTAAPAGTYAIDIETGELCGYIAPAAYTVAKVGYVDTTADSEQILVGALSLPNTAEDDRVVEYDGVAKDDYVAYYQLQDVYVLIKLEEVTGSVTKIDTNKEGLKVVTLDGSKEYTQSTASGTISNTLGAAALTSGFDYKQTYTFYLDPAGKFVCFETVEGGAFDMANTFYVLGVMSRDEKDNYGKKSTWFFARGIDMTGNEAMVPIGVEVTKGNPSTMLGTKTIDEENTFYSVEDLTGKEEKEYSLKKLVGFPTAYNADDPTATYVFTMTGYGQTGADWQEGGKFEYGVAEQLANNGTFEAGVYCYNHKATKYIVVEGTADQDYPLETSVATGSGTFKFAKNVTIKALFTRQTNGTNNIEAMVFPMAVDQSVNGTMIYVPKDNTLPTGTDAIGNVYSVYNGTTGEPMELTFSADLESIPVGYYSVGYDADEEIYKLAVDENDVPVKVPAADTETKFEQRDRTDGRYFESVVYDVSLTAYTGSTLWFPILNNTICSSSCSGVKVVDARSDEQVAKDGVARITTLDQVWALKDSMPWVTIELDMCHTYSPSKVVTAFVEVYNNREFGIDNLVYAYDYNASKVTVVNGEINALGDVINLPDGVVAGAPGFYNLLTGGNGAVYLNPANIETTAGVAFSTRQLPSCGATFNAVDDSIDDILDYVANYDVIEYQILETEDRDILMIMGAGDADAEGITIEAPVDSNEFDTVVDTTDSGITLANLNSKQNSLCLIYSTYEMTDGRVLLVVDDVDAGVAIDNDNASELEAIADAEVIDNSGNNIASVADLQTKIADGYVFSAKAYEVNGETKLVIVQCVNGNAVTGTLTAADFAKGFVKLTGDADLGNGLTVSGNWTIDLNGYTLTGTGAPYFTVNSGKSLTIEDSGVDGTIEGIEATDAMIAITGGTVTLNSGILTGHTNTDTNGNTAQTIATEAGGAIGLRANNSKFIMNGGEISGNSAERGGAIAAWDSVSTGSVITINGGEIVNNASIYSTNGGTAETIYTQSGATLNINGGIVGPGATNNGNALWLRTTTINITGNPKVYGMTVGSACTLSVTGLTEGAYIEENGDAPATTDDTVVLTNKVYTCATGVLPLKALSAVGGTVELSTYSALAGSTVTVTATPDTGYELVAILVDGEAITGNTFVVSAKHKVTAEFALKSYDIDLEVEGDGEVELSADSAEMGDTVTITATAGTGMELNYIKVNGEVLADGVFSFEMPAEDVTVEVKFGAHPYNITIASTAVGTVEVDATGDKATAGTLVTVTVTPAAGYAVTGLSASEGVVVTETTAANAAVTAVRTYTFTMPAADIAITASGVRGVAVTRATAGDLPTDYEVETNAFGVTTANIESKLATNYINFTKYGNVVVVTACVEKADNTLTQTSGTVAAGHYELAGNLDLTNSLTIAAGTEVIIDLNGKTITMTGKDAYYIDVKAGGKLTIRDTLGGGKLQFKNTVAGHAAINVNGTFVLEGGELTGWSRINGGAYGAGGMMNLWDGATVIMTGGKITGNDCNGATVMRSQTAGAINVTITGGEISGNHAQAGSLIEVKGTAAKNAYLTIGGDAKIGNNTWGAGNAVFAATGTGHEIQCYDTHVVIEDGANIGCIYNDADNGTTTNSSFTISGSVVAESVRWSAGAETPVVIEDLESGASIKSHGSLGNSQMDSTVVKSTTADNRYLYTYVND